ncbi:hypothetical protein [Chitinimonas koreensis]|uniref:hypothetical protein n=1 Tax=Chitinimonas koreensis TaxID=356302 RepID=UPI00165452AF|nr:hypothetical protein [Chitinimonas koreensis]QNM97026.1 hypothetical protein H9L41_01405 [Chitinimonas koreensis]
MLAGVAERATAIEQQAAARRGPGGEKSMSTWQSCAGSRTSPCSRQPSADQRRRPTVPTSGSAWRTSASPSQSTTSW